MTRDIVTDFLKAVKQAKEKLSASTNSKLLCEVLETELCSSCDGAGWYLDESYDKSSYWNMKKKSCIICLGKGYLNIES